jgi:small conductance mechanosensitive channel
VVHRTDEVAVAASNTRFDTGQVIDHLFDKVEWLVAKLPMLGLAVLAVAAAWWIGTWLSKRTVLDRVSRRNPFLQDLVRTSIRWGVVLAGVVVALELLGATKLVGAVLGTAGVLGVALGFAFKDILENYLAGLLLSVRQPFAPKDWVVIDGNEGFVVALTSRATILMTLQGNQLRLPNALVFRGVMLNYTRNPKRRLEFQVGIGVNESIPHAQHVGTAELLRVPGVVADPPPRALVQELGDWSVVISFQAWVDQSSHDFLLVRSAAIRAVKEALDREGVDMPVPTYRIDLATAAPSPDAADGHQPSTRPPGDVPPADTRKTSDLLEQVDAECRERQAQNLLNADAPRE